MSCVNRLAPEGLLLAVIFSTAALSQPAHPGREILPPEINQTSIGVLMNGRFHHRLTGTEFSLPAGWRILYQGPSSGHGEQVGLAFGDNPANPQIEAFVWMRPEAHTPEEIPDQLRSSVDYKAGQREGMPGYKMLKKTAAPRSVGGQQALSVQAQFTGNNGGNLIEYHTWVTSTKTHVYISARMSEAAFPDLKARIDQMLDTFSIP